MNPIKTTRKIKALGLCSGGLDSILSALLLVRQGIDVTWISFTTPFFSSKSAEKAADQTGIPLMVQDITLDYMEMMKQPKAGFGKNMNPCMDCHALMFAKAGEHLEKEGFHFLFSGEVLGQRPKSQNRNSLRYVEKNSGFDGWILRPLSARCLPETLAEKQGLVDRNQLLDITGRSRKIQTQLAADFGVKRYPAPAGGCLLTDKLYSQRLQDLMTCQTRYDICELYLLRYGRHFRLDADTKVIVGRSQKDNTQLLDHLDITRQAHLRHETLASPDVIVTGCLTPENLQTAAMICTAYTKSRPGELSRVVIRQRGTTSVVTVKSLNTDHFRPLMISSFH